MAVERVYVTQSQLELLEKNFGYKIQHDNDDKGLYIPATKGDAFDLKLRAALAGKLDTNGVGTVVEKQATNKNVLDKTQEQVVNLNSLYERLSLDTDEKKEKLNTALANKGFDISSGEIAINANNKANLEEVLKEYVKPITTFSEDTPPALIKFLQDENIIQQSGDNSYEILDNEKLQQYLKQEAKEDASVTSEFETTKVTTTKTKRSAVDIPDDLSTSRKARKETRKQYEKIVAEKVESGEVEAQKEYIIATSRYNGAINRAKNKLSKECRGRYADILNKFMESDAVTEQEKAQINDVISKFSENDENDQKLLLHAWNTDSGREQVKSFNDLSPEQINIAKHLAIKGVEGLDSETLLTRMAVKKVMDGRSDRAKRKDNEWFIENQAERITNSKAAEQKKANTVVYYSKADAKSKDNDPSKNHVYIGDYGRKLIAASPRTFCDEVDASSWNEAMGPKVKDKNGVTHYFKFNQKLYDEYCDKAANNVDPEQYAKDNNMTLKEARKRIMMLGNLYDINGNELTIDQAVGNDNGKVGNGELNKFRHFIEKGGTHIDKNPTNALRAAYVLGLTGLSALPGYLGVGALANAAGDVVRDGVVQTAGTLIPGSTVTKTIDGYTITDQVTFNFNGEKFTKQITHKIDPQDVTFNIDEKFVPGQEVKYHTEGARINKVRARNAAAIAGGLTGLGVGLATMHKINFAGKNNDWIIDTDVVEESQDQVASSLQLDLGQTALYIMSGNMNYKIEADDESKLKQHKLSHDQVNVDPQQASKLKANHVITQISNNWGDVNDVYAPPILDAADVTSNAGNGKHRVKYKKLTDSEVETYKQQGKIPQNDNGPFYILEDVLDENDNNKSIKTSHDEIYRLKAKPEFSASDGTITFSYQLTQGDGYAGAGKTSVQKHKVQSWWTRK